MTDVWELAAYVEAHPQNHGQRWRLAKKLYTSFEYRLALEHLLILKNETEPRESVMRYLAATYYRLGRHEEAVKALEEGLTVWPKDLGLREQLARSQTEAGDHERALQSWRKLQGLSPDHAYADHAIKRLQALVDREAQEKSRTVPPARVAAPGMADPGPATVAAAPAEITCPKCGQKNSATFKSCWQCGTPFGSSADFLDEVIKKAERAEPVHVPSPIAAGLLLAALFAVGVYGTLRGMARASQIAASSGPPQNFADAVDPSVLWTRIMIGAALLLAWPLAWWLGASVAKAGNRVYDATLFQAGALLALITFALLWLPWGWISAAAAAPLVLSALIAFVALRLPFVMAAKLWIAQLGVIAAVVLVVIAGRHGPGLIFDLPGIVTFVQQARSRPPSDVTLRAPGTLRVQWQSSGSPWLDKRIDRARLTLRSAPKQHRVFLETMQGKKQLFFEQVGMNNHHRDLDPIRIGTDYTFNLSCREDTEVRVTVEGLLPFTAQPSN